MNLLLLLSLVWVDFPGTDVSKFLLMNLTHILQEYKIPTFHLKFNAPHVCKLLSLLQLTFLGDSAEKGSSLSPGSAVSLPFAQVGR